MKSVFLFIFLSILCFSSCTKHEVIQSSINFTKKNEIITYTPVDKNKTQILISVTGNYRSNLEHFVEAFELKFPNIQAIIVDITGGTQSYSPLKEYLQNNMTPDIVVNSLTSFNKELALKYYENLSAKPYIANFTNESLQIFSIDSDIYVLPGPAIVDCITYNKTLFDKYGWKVPETFDEFVKLCLQITKDTEGTITPWISNAKYENNFSVAIQAFAFGEVFAGMQNRGWYKDFCNGKATFKNHIEPLYNVIQTLIDNKILLEEHFSYSATTRGENFIDGKIAMYNNAAHYMEGKGYEFEYMAYPGIKKSQEYINQTYTMGIAVPKKDRSKKSNDAIDAFMSFFSSPEGQKKYIDTQLMVTNIKENSSSTSQTNKTIKDLSMSAFSKLQPTINAGRTFSLINFSREGYKTNFSIHDDARQLVNGNKTIEMCIEQIDRQPYIKLEDEIIEIPKSVCYAESAFTVLETSNFIADIYRDAMNADIALISNREAYRGNLMNIFPGNITEQHIQVLMPRSLGNGTKLIKVEMTGKQLLQALNSPVGANKRPVSTYAFSGLKATVFPWKEYGNKYGNITLYDGTPIQENAIYHVAFWEGTIHPEFITKVLETHEKSWEQIVTTYLEAKTKISPENNDRITLDWRTS